MRLHRGDLDSLDRHVAKSRSASHEAAYATREPQDGPIREQNTCAEELDSRFTVDLESAGDFNFTLYFMKLCNFERV